MSCRPVDASGDILPVLRSSDLLRGRQAAAELVRDRLRLLSGDWWENPGRGNAVPEMLKESRLTEGDRQMIWRYLTSYIRETPGVLDIREVRCSAEGGRFCCSCVIVTGDGTAGIEYGMQGPFSTP